MLLVSSGGVFLLRGRFVSGRGCRFRRCWLAWDARAPLTQECGGVFQEPVGGILKAPQTVNLTIVGAAASFTKNSGTIPDNLCTIRIPGMSCDGTVKDIGGTPVLLAPGYDGTSGTVDATVWHDAWKVSDGHDTEHEGWWVRIRGIPLRRVNSRVQAESEWGFDARYLPPVAGRRLVTLANDFPYVWWIERYKAASYIGVYPMPGYAMPIEVRAQVGVTAVDDTNVLTSTETYNLTESIARDVWRPLAVRAFYACPYMKDLVPGPVVERQAERAYEILAQQAPKKPALRPWNAPRLDHRMRLGLGQNG